MNIVYNSDCLEAMREMPDKCFDLAIVDPPYGIGLNFSDKEYQKHTWNKSIPTKEYFEQLYRVSVHQIIWGANYYTGYIKDVGIIIHNKLINKNESPSLNLSHADIASCSLQKRITMFDYEWRGNVQNGTINWKNTGPDARIHPTQKPIALYTWLLQQYAKTGWRILDTHIGSGSIRIACDQLGFDLEGYEIDKDYFEAQEKRFARHKSQLTICS